MQEEYHCNHPRKRLLSRARVLMITVTQAGNQLPDKMLYHHAASGAYKLQLLPCDSSHMKKLSDLYENHL